MPALLTTDRLPETATRKDWGFAYVASNDPTALADGTLTVTEHTGKRVRRTVSSRYSVQFAPPAGGGRVFLLVLEARTGDLDTAAGRAGAARVGEVYECRVGVRNPSCTCPGFAAGGRTCKHMVALDALVESGDLADPMAGDDREWDDFRESCEAASEPPEWADICPSARPEHYEDMYGNVIACH